MRSLLAFLCSLAVLNWKNDRRRGNSLFVKALSNAPPSNTNVATVTNGALGPPEPLASLSVGSSIRAFRPSAIGQAPHDFEIERVALNPPIFLLRNVLTIEECNYLMDISTDMRPAETVTRQDVASRKRCQVAWVSNEWTQTLSWSLGNLFLSLDVKSHHQSGVEDLQILQYTPGGEYVLHHDGVPRVLTVLYYLNGVGETWFPLADTTQSTSVPRNYENALRLCRNDANQGIIVGGHNFPIQQGDAVAFYNYLDDSSGEINWKAIHSGLPVLSTHDKWVANHWFRHGALAERG
jgi:2OG-Fe(II) oxygenase superfamily